MATEEAVKLMSGVASGDLSANQFFLVKKDADGQIAVSGDGGNAVGSLYECAEATAAGKAVTYACGGRIKAMCGGTVTAGNRAASDAAGEGVEAAAGDYVCGVWAVSGVDGDVGEIDWDKNGIEPAA